MDSSNKVDIGIYERELVEVIKDLYSDNQGFKEIVNGILDAAISKWGSQEEPKKIEEYIVNFISQNKELQKMNKKK